MIPMLDAIREISMDEIVEKIARDKETKSVLAGAGSGRSKIVYDVMLAQEGAKWEAAKQAAEQLRISERQKRARCSRRSSGRAR